MNKTKNKKQNKLEALIPRGDWFGTKEEDEFKTIIKEKEEGVFKAYEYPSIIFTFTNNEKLFNNLYEKAQQNNTSIKQEINENKKARELITRISKEMKEKPELSRQIINHTLSRTYIKDNQLTKEIKPIIKEKKFTKEKGIAIIANFWKELTDFYCLEGYLGGQGEENPFIKNGNHNLITGFLDSIEKTLPSAYEIMSEKEQKKLLLRMSRIIERDYEQIKQGIMNMKQVFKQEETSKEEEQRIINGIKELSTTRIETNVENGKFYNSIIRFHNWLPIKIKEEEKETGAVYDSFCEPTKKLEEMISEELKNKLKKIRDATSPKGIAIIRMAEEEQTGNKEKIIKSYKQFKEKIQEKKEYKKKNEIKTLTLKDHAFYQGITGGKWKGIKLLRDAKKLFNLKYEIPESIVITANYIEEKLAEKGIIPEGKNLFSMKENQREKLEEKIKALQIIKKDEELRKEMTRINQERKTKNEIIFRSSMYGEDGQSNFAGTYDSIIAKNKEEWDSAINKVIMSYYSKEAVKSREDIGLAHKPGIAIIVQEVIKGRGGVIHLTKKGIYLSTAQTAEEAVNGRGTSIKAKNIKELTRKKEASFLEKYEKDLETLKETFGEIDLEYIISNNKLYLTQMRPKITPTKKTTKLKQYDEITINNIGELERTRINKEAIIYLPFLGLENINDEEDKIMNFIRKNKEYIRAIRGEMPRVAHIPNKIEGHFRIPYLTKGDVE